MELPPAKLVALVADDALPVSAPMKDVEDTEVSPARVVEEEPSDIAVVPIVTDELVRAPFGIEVSPAPLPENPVAVNIPVDGINDSLVVDSLAALFPAAVVHRGYTDVAVAVSSVLFTGTVMFALPLNPTLLIVLDVVSVAALPVVFWFRVGKSPATAIDSTPVVVVFFSIPVPSTPNTCSFVSEASAV